MSITRKAGVLALAAGLAAGAPTAAQARDRGDSVKAPTRIASKLKSAERALSRAQDRADDGEAAAAATSLTASRRHLSSATKSALKRTVADSTTGEASTSAVTRTDHRVVGGTTAMLDGAGDTVVAAVATTLDAALDGRDSVIAAIAALDAEDRADYASVLERVVDQTEDELEELAETAADDELTADATSALGAAATQVAATKAAAEAQLTALEGDDADASDDAEAGSPTGAAAGVGREDCPRPGGGRRPQGGPDAPGDDAPEGSTGT